MKQTGKAKVKIQLPPLLTAKTQTLVTALHVDKDWHYRNEEKRWVPMNDQSAWYLCTERNRKWIPDKIFIR